MAKLVRSRNEGRRALIQPIRYYASHTLPFLVLILALYLGRLLDVPRTVAYPFQSLATAGLLLYYRRAYRNEIRVVFEWSAVLSGILVFVLWVSLDGLYPHLGAAKDQSYAAGASAYEIAIRLIGASLVVPVAEEVFWRSFALRFLIRSDFKAVPLGQFTWFSFVCISLAFGFEHHRWLAGIIAGMVYAALLYRSKNLFSPILSHAVTNALLGIYVIATGKWYFW